MYFKKIIFTILICLIFSANVSMANVEEHTSNLTEKRIEYIMNKSNPKLSEVKKQAYKKSIIKHSSVYGLCPVFVAAMIHRESNFREKLVSSANCRGAMQVGYRFHKEKCNKIGIKEKDLHSIDHGINIGCQVIKEYLIKSGGNRQKALLRYNGVRTNKETPYVRDILRMTKKAYPITA